jgi:hypothetical protein
VETSSRSHDENRCPLCGEQLEVRSAFGLTGRCDTCGWSFRRSPFPRNELIAFAVTALIAGMVFWGILDGGGATTEAETCQQFWPSQETTVVNVRTGPGVGYVLVGRVATGSGQFYSRSVSTDDRGREWRALCRAFSPTASVDPTRWVAAWLLSPSSHASSAQPDSSKSLALRDLTADQAGAGLAAIVMWEVFGVPQSTMERIRAPASGGCTEQASGAVCVATHASADPTVCRGVSVAYLAGALYEMVSAGQSIHSTFRVTCARHRVDMEYVPEGRTTVTQYDRSTGNVVYRNSARS